MLKKTKTPFDCSNTPKENLYKYDGRKWNLAMIVDGVDKILSFYKYEFLRLKQSSDVPVDDRERCIHYKAGRFWTRVKSSPLPPQEILQMHINFNRSWSGGVGNFTYVNKHHHNYYRHDRLNHRDWRQSFCSHDIKSLKTVRMPFVFS